MAILKGLNSAGNLVQDKYIYKPDSLEHFPQSENRGLYKLHKSILI